MFRGRQLAKESVIAIVPPILLILCVLGAIFQGIATPSEVGSVGAVVACLLALFNGRLTWSVIGNASRSTANITGLVMMMLFASNFFSKVFQELGGQNLIEDWLSDVPGGKWGFIIIANIAVFLLGVNLEFLEISFIVMPLFVPVAAELGIDPVWFMVTLAVNLNIAFISPPVGFSLFYLQSVKPPEVKTIDIHKGALPFCALQIVALVICIAVPGVVTWLVDSENVDWGVLGNSAGRWITIAVLVAVALWFFVRPALAPAPRAARLTRRCGPTWARHSRNVRQAAAEVDDRPLGVAEPPFDASRNAANESYTVLKSASPRRSRSSAHRPPPWPPRGCPPGTPTPSRQPPRSA